MRLYFYNHLEKKENNFNIHILSSFYLSFSFLYFSVRIKHTAKKIGYFQNVSEIIICIYLPERQTCSSYMLGKYSVLNLTKHMYNQIVD